MCRDHAVKVKISTNLILNRSQHASECVWVRSCGGIADAFIDKWQLSAISQLPSAWNIVVHVLTAGGTDAYLKLCCPDGEFRAAAHALLSNNSTFLGQVLQLDMQAGALLLAAVPGTHLSYLPADAIVCPLIGHLLSNLNTLKTTPEMIKLTEWCEPLVTFQVTGDSQVDNVILENSPRCQKLLDSTVMAVWLHGDLHHDNILVAHDGTYVAIDPKGLVGDASFDVCTYVRNHVPNGLHGSNLTAFLVNRIQLISDEAGYPTDRAFAWAAAGNALSLSWDLLGKPTLTEHHQRQIEILAELNRSAEAHGW